MEDSKSNTRDVVKIVNVKQAGLYIKHGLKPLNIYYDGKLVIEFDKEESKPLFSKWLNHELN